MSPRQCAGKLRSTLNEDVSDQAATVVKLEVSAQERVVAVKADSV